MSSYRCLGCRGYHRGPPFRRLGLGGVCSPDCAAGAAARRRRSGPVPSDGIPARTRTVVLERDGGCRFCGVPVGLHLHHISYRSEGVDHSEHNLITLCVTHHDLVHSNKRRWKPVLESYIENLYAHGRKRYLLELASTPGE